MNLPRSGADPINAPYDVSDGRKSAEGKQENGREASVGGFNYRICPELIANR